jgi:hypothetical protein
MVPECQHTLSSGKKCRAIALRDKALCRHHVRNRKRKAPRPYVMRQTSLLGPLPEITGREAVQRTLSLTIQALANDSISVYRAQALITLLQLAAKAL